MNEEERVPDAVCPVCGTVWTVMDTVQGMDTQRMNRFIDWEKIQKEVTDEKERLSDRLHEMKREAEIALAELIEHAEKIAAEVGIFEIPEEHPVHRTIRALERIAGVEWKERYKGVLADEGEIENGTVSEVKGEGNE